MTSGGPGDQRTIAKSPPSMADQMLAGSSADFDDPDAFIVSAVPVGKSGSIVSPNVYDIITCMGANAGALPYDDPHVSSESNLTTINAHLSVTCNHPVATITLKSRMCDITSGYCSVYTTRHFTAKSSASTGGDRPCVPSIDNYRANGTVTFNFGPGYVPTSNVQNVVSHIKAFQRLSQHCVNR